MTFIEKNLINLQTEFTNQKEAFRYLANLAFENGRTTSVESVYQGLVEREQESTTGFGKNIAIPHTKNKAVKEPTILVVRNGKLMEWQALDNQPVHTLICLLVPDNKDDVHLRLLAKISRKLMHTEFTDLLKNGNAEQILNEINLVLNH
ncbi:fructose PTS transporter subunit IIA [Listeria sp. PSOL-1]|uniref:fructose PTS transporter subunit IIA n=1 Tax=Listeria sp. PSOL-1 TaxID=1844999 RepID=UPI0013D87DE2|nr:fructose PTS transporter subunit IIA [Listeria sp. PSOL-1]